jgi:thiamine pyrophosphate-dependent acetolactate synthase large subunit-like protein
MSSVSQSVQITAAQAVVDALVRCGITCGFGIPSIHNIALYDGLRQEPRFRHWIVRHEQAAVFAADGFYRSSGRAAAVFASTGPGNLFTVGPLLESFQTTTPVIVIGTNVASHVLGKTCGALHETPHQLEILKPLTRFATRVTSAESIPDVIAAAARASGPAFIEIPNDLLLAPATARESLTPEQPAALPVSEEIARAIQQIDESNKPVLVLGDDVMEEAAAVSVQKLAEALHAPVMTTTSGKGAIADDHPLAMGCISRLGVVQELLLESDLLVTIGARLTEFDTGRFTLKAPARHIQIDRDPNHAGLQLPVTGRLIGGIADIAKGLTNGVKPKAAWWDTAGRRRAENEKLSGLKSEAYQALFLLRGALNRDDVVVNDQSILNYWASAFFPVLSRRTFLYPTGSGTLGYGLPAAIGAACAAQQQGRKARVVCIAGDGGFQYTSHELATLAHYGLPVKILLVNDSAYGIIGFLQQTMFGHTHEIKLKNPDFCVLAEAHGIAAQRVSDFDGLRRQLPGWLSSPGPALLEWRTELKAPWAVGAIQRPRIG